MLGTFISLEGCEGVGKSTQVRLLKEYLEKNNYDFISLREPGGTEISEKIREILLSLKNQRMNEMTETMLYAAARTQLINEVIYPALGQGKMVIADRFVDSTIAYQGVARKIGIDTVIKLHELTCDNLWPDITIFLDLDPILAFKRKGGVDRGDRLENAGLEFHQDVYKGYKEVARRYPNRVVSIQPLGDKYDTHNKIIETLKQKGFLND